MLLIPIYDINSFSYRRYATPMDTNTWENETTRKRSKPFENSVLLFCPLHIQRTFSVLHWRLNQILCSVLLWINSQKICVQTFKIHFDDLHCFDYCLCRRNGFRFAHVLICTHLEGKMIYDQSYSIHLKEVLEMTVKHGRFLKIMKKKQLNVNRSFSTLQNDATVSRIHSSSWLFTVLLGWTSIALTWIHSSGVNSFGIWF